MKLLYYLYILIAAWAIVSCTSAEANVDSAIGTPKKVMHQMKKDTTPTKDTRRAIAPRPNSPYLVSKGK